MNTIDLNGIIPKQTQEKIPEFFVNASLRQTVNRLCCLLRMNKGNSKKKNRPSQNIDETLSKIKQSEMGSILVWHEGVLQSIVKSIVTHMAEKYIDDPKLHQNGSILSEYTAMAGSIVRYYPKDQTITEEKQELRKNAVLDDVLKPWNEKKDVTVPYLYWKETITDIVNKTISEYTQNIHYKQLQDFGLNIITDFRKEKKSDITACNEALHVLEQDIKTIMSESNNDTTSDIEEKINAFLGKREYPNGQGRQEDTTADKTTL